MSQWMLAIWFLVPLPLQNPAEKFSVHVLMKSSLKDFEHYLASMWNEWNCTVVWTLFSIALLWDWIWKKKLNFFQSCGHCWVFQICWHIEHSDLSIIFRVLSSSAGIPSPLLVLFVVMLPKAHLTSHPMMSGSRWVIIPLCNLSH